MRGASAAAVAVALGLAACAGGGDVPDPAPGDDTTTGQVQGQQAAYGTDDPEAGPACFLALDERAADRLWRLAVAGSAVDGPPPQADGFRAPVAGVFLGQRPTGGYAIAVTAVEEPDAAGEPFVLEVAVQEPGEDQMTIQVLTSPYVLYVLPEGTTGVTLRGDLEVECQQRVPEPPVAGDPGRAEAEDQ